MVFSETDGEKLAWACASFCAIVMTLQNNPIGRDLGLWDKN